jgi:hypothetical protein
MTKHEELGKKDSAAQLDKKAAFCYKAAETFARPISSALRFAVRFLDLHS